MINVPVAFRQKLYRNERDYLLFAGITLSDGTVLNLENDQIWNNGISIEDAVSEDDSFTALGAAILGSATVTINNMDESFSDYDFMNAKVVLRVGLEIPDGSGGTRVENVQKGVYTVDDTSYNGALIVLTMLDNMEQFDRPYNDPLAGSKLAYPASLGEIVRNACRNCGVTLLTQSFPHDDFIVQTRPIDDALTYREVLGWAASIAGCFARCDRYGRLELKWFDRATLDARDSGYDGGEFDETNPYATGDALDGGTFSPWSTGSAADGGEFTDERPIHHIYALYSQNISMDDVVITGVRILVENDDEDAEEQILPYTAGQTGYVIEISGNDFITKTNAQTVADWLGVQLIGLRFRKASFSHANDPSIEAGDIGVLYDRKNREYPILITRTVFSVGSAQETVCGAETPSRNSATRYESVSKSRVESRKLLNKEQSIREQAIREVERALAEKSGLYMTVETTTSGDIYYLHDHPNLEESGIVWKMTKDAVGVTTNYDGDDTVWNSGLTVDGTLITQLISTVGLDASWITTGLMSANRIKGGELILGGRDNGNGILIVKDASDNQVGLWNNTLIDLLGSSTWTSNTKRGARFSNGSWEFYNKNTQTDAVTVQGYIQPISSYQLRIGQNLQNGSFGGISLYTSGVKNGTTYTSELKVGLDSGGSGTCSLPQYTFADVLILGNYRALCEGSGIRLGTFSSSYASQSNWLGGVWVRHNGGNSAPSGVYIENCELYVKGNHYKSKVVETEDYGDRVLFCYEMATPIFGDIGSAALDEDGVCYVDIDDVFQETAELGVEYQVFLQKEGPGDLWVDEKARNYFVVKGTPDLKFSWEIKARQKALKTDRLEDLYQVENNKNTGAELSDEISIEEYYDNLLDSYIKEQEGILYETA